MKFYGKIGYIDTTETRPGVYEAVVTERDYYGDVNRKISRWQTADKLNDDLNVNNEISIVADQYAYQHFSRIHYVIWEGVKWKVNTITVQHPRLILEIGGVYNDGT